MQNQSSPSPRRPNTIRERLLAVAPPPEAVPPESFPRLPDDPEWVVDVAAQYIRVSGSKQLENVSVQDQRALWRLGAERGLPVLRFEEQGLSAETLEDRVELPSLLDGLRAGEVEGVTDVAGRRIARARIVCVIADCLDRLSRDEDLLDSLTIKKTLKDARTPLVTPGRTYDFDREGDSLVATMEFAFAGNFKRNGLRKSVRAQFSRAAGGEYAGGGVAYGYRLVRDVLRADGTYRGRLEIDEVEAEVVRAVYDWYVNGLPDATGVRHPASTYAIAAHLNRHGLGDGKGPRTVTVRVINRRPDGAFWDRGEQRPFAHYDIQRWLSDRRYLGYIDRTPGEKARTWHRDQQAVEAHNPALQIVGLELFDRAAAVRRERANGPRRTACSERPLVGLLRCPLCHGTMVARTQRRDGRDGDGRPIERAYHSYLCLNRRKYGALTCKGVCLPEGPVRDAVDVLLVERLRAFGLERWMADEHDARAREDGDEQAQALELALHQTKTGLANLAQAIFDGTVTPDEAAEVRLRGEAKHDRLAARLARLRARGHDQDELLAVVAQVQPNLSGLIRALPGPAYRTLARMVFAGLEVETAGTPHRPDHVATVVAAPTTALYDGLLAKYGPGDTFGAVATAIAPKVAAGAGTTDDALHRLLALLLPAAA